MSGIEIEKAPVSTYTLDIGDTIGGSTIGKWLVVGAANTLQQAAKNPLIPTATIITGSIIFGNAGEATQNNTELFWDNSGAKMGIGINSSLLAKLHIKGSGTTSATKSLIITNSSGSSILEALDNGNVNINGAVNVAAYKLNVSGIIHGSSTIISDALINTPSISDGAGSVVVNFSVGTQFTRPGVINTNGSTVRIEQNFSPTSGSIEYSQLAITTTINQTGGANGITRGIYINPTLTSAADFRAFESIRGNIVFGNLPTSAAGLPTGAIWNNLGILTIV